VRQYGKAVTVQECGFLMLTVVDNAFLWPPLFLKLFVGELIWDRWPWVSFEWNF